MLKHHLPSICLLLVAACGPAELPVQNPPPAPPADVQPPPQPEQTVSNAQDTDAAFVAFSVRFLADYLRREPTRATEAGEHRYDAFFPDPSEQGEAEFRTFVQASLKELDSIDKTRLNSQNRIDAAIIDTQLRYWLFAIDELKDLSWNPITYTGMVGDGLDPLITRTFAPLEERMQSLKGRLKGVPAIIAVAKKRLNNPPRIFTETAITQNKGLIALCKNDLPQQFAAVPGQKAELEAAAKAATAALEDFQTFLEKDLLTRSNGDFRLGRERFQKKLRFALDAPVDIDQVVKGARDLLTSTHDEMFETSKELWPILMGKKALPKTETPDQKKALIRQVLDKIATDHPTNATIVKEAEKLVADATEFVKKHDLVRIPDEPCNVIEMPEYRRGVAVAYCDASGPLEKKQETFFAIAPTPKDWTKQRVESFYREYNRSMLWDLTVHEAMPGHFLQIMHNNKFPSQLRAVFSSGPFVEGWAVYTEWLMAKYGFGGPKVRLSRQKMVLRLSANAILDYGVHASTMDEKEALQLMTQDAFQEEGEAVGKWRRAKLTSAQLTTYYYGFTEMMRLRVENEKKPGFSERAYHDRVLSFGAPPMRHLRTLME